MAVDHMKIMEESPQYFGVLYPFITEDDITDIDYNGHTLWITDSGNHRRICTDSGITESFVTQFTKRVANTVSKEFNKQNPILEAETDNLRITIVHESVAISGRSICIRKSLPYTRMTSQGMLSSKYCTKEMLDLLIGCVRDKKNMVFCGEPGVGKTECAKFFSGFISPEDRVITIEDNPEWHYRSMFPDRDCVELRINPQMDYTKAIKTCLRLNPKWMMLSEARSCEVRYLMEGFSTGVKGFTTLHADDVRKVPDRIINMSQVAGDTTRMENDIYSFFDVAILIRRKVFLEEEQPVVRRFIDQIGLFSRENGSNHIELIVNEGEFTEAGLDYFMKYRMSHQNMEEIKSEVTASEKATIFQMPQVDKVAEEAGTYGGKKPVIG